ncbi:MAG: SH3 domain-containing protein [Nodosilinea sp.]
MSSRMLQNLSFGAIALISASTAVMPPALAQNPRPLTENTALIRGCRQLNQADQIFDNSALGPIANRIGTLPAGTQVTLTGAVTQGRAQVFLRSGSLSPVQPVGWLNAANLGPCTLPPTADACFRADQSLAVRSGPSTGYPVVAGYSVNNLVRASTNPPTQHISSGDRRRWMQVRISDGTNRWIARTGANGVGSNITPTNCP